MKVILTEKVKALGAVGECVNVSPGFARNYLVPNRLGVLADDANSKMMEDQQKRLAKKVEAEKTAAKELATKISGLTLAFVKKVGGNGKLFGTVTNAEIAKVLENDGLAVERRHIVIESPIKTVGTFTVKAKLFQGVEAVFKVKVEMDAKQAEELRLKQLAAAEKKARGPVETETEATAELTDEVATEE